MVAKDWGVGVDLGLRLRRDTPHRSLRLFRFLKKVQEGGTPKQCYEGKDGRRACLQYKKKGKMGALCMCRTNGRCAQTDKARFALFASGND